MLPSWPMVKISIGPVHFTVTLDTLSGYPEPWSSKTLESETESTILDLVLFLHVLPDVLNFFPQT